MFSGDIEREEWHEIGSEILITFGSYAAGVGVQNFFWNRPK